MKKYFFKLLLIFLPSLSFAQFDYSLDLISSVDYTRLTNSFSRLNGFRTLPMYNARVGINFNVKLEDNTFIKTGLRFAQVGYANSIEELRWPSDFGPNGFEPDPSLPRYLDIITKQQLIEVPFLIRYEFGDNKFGFFVEAGISPHFYINTKEITSSNISIETKIINERATGMKRVRMAYVFGLGIDYKMNDKWQMFLQPTARSYTAIENMMFSMNPLKNIGLEVGIRRGFTLRKNKNQNK